MSGNYVLHGWKLSYFSAKLRAYLRYKGVSFEENAVNAFDLRVRIPKRTGSTVIPVLELDSGQWLQDTRDIIRTLESDHEQWPAVPESPKQFVLAQLLEAWADDFWLPSAMHYRWSYEENFAQFEAEAAQNLVPVAPGMLGKKVVKKLAGRLRSFCPVLGVVPGQRAVIETWTNNMFGHLERHFAGQPFLLGGRPTLADFALCGPLYAHLYRDPAPNRLLFEAHPNVARWVLQTHGNDDTYTRPLGELLPNDQIASTLTPVVHSLCDEFLPMVSATANRVTDYVAINQLESGATLPRSLESVEFPFGGTLFSRAAVPFGVWKMQRVKHEFDCLTSTQRKEVDEWLSSLSQGNLSDIELGACSATQRACYTTGLGFLQSVCCAYTFRAFAFT